MERLWAPWRLEYIVAERTEGCIFCLFAGQDDDESNRVLCRGEHAFVVMNAFPYSNGHLLVAPYRHVSAIGDLADGELLDIMSLVRRCCGVLDAACRPDGYNVGFNIGTAAGAGIADHVHVHVVPRWNGDTNFMPVLAETKVLPEALDVTYRKLRPGFETDD